jgi:hypothetical protein
MFFSEEEKDKLLKAMREYAIKAKSSSREEAIAFLFKTGMYTETGELKPEFK